ncbi:hypothetical protein RGQ29_026869 [Quercus rubra]|uniref:GDSL esterase/lipase n=1 Tax=Quercus rubra TaxID=3512 RepID=A0AAN7EMV0_QUERU|nr:hypothetical protein RGQ29_026869 [Quercus rubra]
MAHNNILVILIILSIFIFMFTYSQAQKAPAMFIFGDSLVDVGNNNHLKFSMNEADFSHYGIDFPNKVFTGRFSNGRNAADFLAEKVGLPTSPPYLSMISNKSNENFLNGVSFASGGAGIFDDTDKQSCSSILNSTNLRQFLSKSLFPIVIGSNDIFAYFQYVDSMALSITVQLKRIYDFGARKFAIVGVGSIGCCPSIRKDIYTDECNAEINYWCANQKRKKLNSVFGFIEVQTACCGLGHLRAVFPCDLFSAYCPNRNDHDLWDAYHPTEAAAHIIVDNMYHDTSNYSFPMNLRDLLAI